MRLNKFLKRYADVGTFPITDNFYDTTWSITKIDDDGIQHTKTYNAAITMGMIKRYFGNRRVRDDLVEMLIDNPTQLYMELTTEKGDVLQINKYKWAALFDIQESYYNPLYNVDAHETITHDYAQDKRTIVGGSQSNSYQHGQQQTTNVYGQDQQATQYGTETNTLQHGTATDTIVYGAHETVDTHKTSPFNDSTNTYVSEVDDTDSKTHTDTTTRGTYTDTETRNTKTDTVTRNAHTDTSTLATYTDSDTIGSKTDTDTRDARKDVDTIRRFGNIGVTKSSELLVDAADSIRNVYLEIMKDYIDYITEGY